MSTFWNDLVRNLGDREDVVNIPGAPILTNIFIDNIQNKVLSSYLLTFNKKVVLDVGAGIGRWTTRFSKYGQEVIALDISREMIKLAKKKLKKSNVTFIVGTACAIPLRENSVDCSFSCTCLQHIDDEEKQKTGISEMARVTRKQIMILELMSSGSNFTKLSHYPTLIIPKALYVSTLKIANVRSIHYHGVDYLPLLKLTEQARNFLFKKTEFDIPSYGGSFKQQLPRIIYQTCSLIATVFSFPFARILFNPNERLTRHFLLIAKK